MYCELGHLSRKWFSFHATSHTPTHDKTPRVEVIFVGHEHGSWVDISFWLQNRSSTHKVGALVPPGAFRLTKTGKKFDTMLFVTDSTKPKKITITVLSSHFLGIYVFTTYFKEQRTLIFFSNELFHLILLQGYLHKISVNHTLVNQTILVHWLSGRYSDYQDFSSMLPHKCHQLMSSTKKKHKYCFNFTSNKADYMFALESGMVPQSWKKTSEMCGSLGGSLPVARSRKELEELVALVLFSYGILPIEAIFMGLIRDQKSKVRI